MFGELLGQIVSLLVCVEYIVINMSGLHFSKLGAQLIANWKTVAILWFFVRFAGS